MMPVIRVSDATWERMKMHARPLEDSADDIVRRALDALEGKKGASAERVSSKRPLSKTRGQKTPQREFREPLMRTLEALGGRARVEAIRKELLPRIKSRLRNDDYATVSTGEQRWWNATCWERNELVKEGLFRSDSPRGQWELSDNGRAFLTSLKSLISSE